MTFTTYIRLFLENLMLMLISSISEAYRSDISRTSRKVSLLMAYFFLTLCFLFFFFIIYQFRATKRWLNRIKYTYSEELFAGLKESNKARFYTLSLVTRRLCL